MGTNYYLYRKRDYGPELQNDIKKINERHYARGYVYQSDYSFDNGISELENGFVWNNRFYPTLAELNKDYKEKLHIGKSSAGWYFHLCVYPELGIDTLDDWKECFANPDNRIVDEYGDAIEANEILSTICDRSGLRFSEDPPSPTAVRGIRNLWYPPIDEVPEPDLPYCVTDMTDFS